MNVCVLEYHGQVVAKKNNKVISMNKSTGRPFIRMNDKAKAQELDMAYKFQEDYIAQGYIEPLRGKLTITMGFWNKDNRAHDMDNQISTVLDALIKGKVIEDDSQKYVKHLVANNNGVDKEDPHVQIIIFED